jgi:hypothetical protein
MSPNVFNDLVPYLIAGFGVMGLLAVVLIFYFVSKTIKRKSDQSAENAAPQFIRAYPGFIERFQATVQPSQGWFPSVNLRLGGFPARLTCSYKVIPGAKPSASRVYYLYRLSIDVGELPKRLSLYVGNKGLWTGLGRVVRSKTPDGAKDIDLDSEEFGNAFVCKGKDVSRARSFLNEGTLAALFDLLNLVSTTSIELWAKGNEWNVEKRMPVEGTSRAALMKERDLIELVDGCNSLFAAYQRACQ